MKGELNVISLSLPTYSNMSLVKWLRVLKGISLAYIRSVASALSSHLNPISLEEFAVSTCPFVPTLRTSGCVENVNISPLESTIFLLIFVITQLEELPSVRIIASPSLNIALLTIEAAPEGLKVTFPDCVLITVQKNPALRVSGNSIKDPAETINDCLSSSSEIHHQLELCKEMMKLLFLL